MGMLDILKGAYLASGAVDKTLEVAGVTANDRIERGTILVIDGGKFRKCTAADATTGDLVGYVSLVESDRTAMAAGGALYTGTGANVLGVAAKLPVVTAVPLNIDGEFLCSEFTGADGGFVEGAYLTFGATGKLAVGLKGTNTVVGQITVGPARKYHNYASINGGMAQGAPVSVIQFASMYIPRTA